MKGTEYMCQNCGFETHDKEKYCECGFELHSKCGIPSRHVKNKNLCQTCRRGEEKDTITKYVRKWYVKGTIIYTV